MRRVIITGTAWTISPRPSRNLHFFIKKNFKKMWSVRQNNISPLPFTERFFNNNKQSSRLFYWSKNGRSENVQLGAATPFVSPSIRHRISEKKKSTDGRKNPNDSSLTHKTDNRRRRIINVPWARRLVAESRKTIDLTRLWRARSFASFTLIRTRFVTHSCACGRWTIALGPRNPRVVR